MSEWTLPLARLGHAISVAPVVSPSDIEPSTLARAQAGDADAFELLVRPHLGRVRRLAYAFAHNWADADDLAQEALLKAFRALPSFEARASLLTWLYSVTRSVCQDYHRSRTARARTQEDSWDDDVEAASSSPQSGPEALLLRKSEAEGLWRSLRRLTPEFRAPLVLFEIEGMAYEDIARIEGVPVGTVRSRLSRARDQLRALLMTAEAQRARESSSPLRAGARLKVVGPKGRRP